jgi:hypothetical protein
MLLGIQLLSFDFQLQDSHLLWCTSQVLRLISRFDIVVPRPQSACTLV